MVSVYRLCVNVAVTALSLFMVTVAGLAVPVRSPLQPENTHPDAGVAVSCTVEPEAYVVWLGFLEIEPLPEVLTVSV